MMFTRVSLLLLVTGLFAGMWSADSPDGRTDAQKRMARRASSPCMVRHTPPVQKSIISTVSLNDQKSLGAIPMPRGIAAGTYLVVDQTGKTQQLIVTGQDGAPTNYANVEQYTVRSGNGRWHFIRLEDSTTPMVRQAHAAVLR